MVSLPTGQLVEQLNCSFYNQREKKMKTDLEKEIKPNDNILDQDKEKTSEAERKKKIQQGPLCYQIEKPGSFNGQTIMVI